MSRRILLPLAALCLAAAPAHAQECNTAVVTDLGFTYAPLILTGASYVIRDNTLESGNLEFREEPRVTAVDPKGVAADRLREGDRIARVNGAAVTSADGTAALLNARPGRSLVLTVRRGDRLVPLTITPTTMHCASSQELVLTRTTDKAPAWTASIAPATMASREAALRAGSRISSVGEVAIVQGAPAGVVSEASARGVYTMTGMAAPASPSPGWLGIAFDCANCSLRSTGAGRIWQFSEPPTVYSVDTGSPAYLAGLRRGDILLRVDGNDILTVSARSRLGQAGPGETLHLTYSRGGKARETSVRVAMSPLAARVAREREYVAVADEMLKSTQALRSSEQESRIIELLSQLERAKAAQSALAAEVERRLDGSPAARTALTQLRSAQESALREQQQMLSDLLRSEQKESQKLDVVEQRLRNVVPLEATGLSMLVRDSAAPAAAASKTQRLRYSGSAGTSNVEVRGAGFVSVQRDGDDLIIVTSDATIRITAPKSRENR